MEKNDKGISSELIEKFAMAQELAKHNIRKKQREENKKKAEDKLIIFDNVNISEEFAGFFNEFGLDGKFYNGKYKQPYQKRMSDVTFMRVNGINELPVLDYKNYFKAGHVSLRSSGVDVYLDIDNVTSTAKFIKNKKDIYVLFDSNDIGMVSSIGALSVMSDNMRPFYDALIYYISKQMSIEIGDVDVVGYDDIYNKAYKTLTCNDLRVAIRHVLFAGEPGTGKSMLIKKLVYNKPKDVIVLNIEVNSNWDLYVPFLNELARGTGKLVWIIIDEIDEYGVNRDISFNKTFELMRLLDGVSKNGNVRFIASTNRVNCLDAALLRVGRFGPIMFVDKPTDEQKRLIVNYYTKKYGVDVDIDMIVSEIKNGFTGCDIRSVFDNCIIYNEPLTTENIINNIHEIRKSMKYVNNSYV